MHPGQRNKDPESFLPPLADSTPSSNAGGGQPQQPLQFDRKFHAELRAPAAKGGLSQWPRQPPATAQQQQPHTARVATSSSSVAQRPPPPLRGQHQQNASGSDRQTDGGNGGGRAFIASATSALPPSQQKSQRPPLVGELEAFIRRELHQLTAATFGGRGSAATSIQQQQQHGGHHHQHYRSEQRMIMDRVKQERALLTTVQRQQPMNVRDTGGAGMQPLLPAPPSAGNDPFPPPPVANQQHQQHHHQLPSINDGALVPTPHSSRPTTQQTVDGGRGALHSRGIVSSGNRSIDHHNDENHSSSSQAAPQQAILRNLPGHHPLQPPLTGRTLQTTATATTFGVPSAEELHPDDRLVIFSEAYLTIAHHFKEYSELLLTIKSEFDAAIQRGRGYQLECGRLRAELDASKQCVQYIVDGETNKLKSVIRQQALDLEEKDRELAKTKDLMADLIREKLKVEVALVDKTNEYEDMRERCKLASDSLRRETERHGKMTAELKNLNKANEKLNAYCQALEEKQQNDQLSHESMSNQLSALKLQMEYLKSENQAQEERLNLSGEGGGVASPASSFRSKRRVGRQGPTSPSMGSSSPTTVPASLESISDTPAPASQGSGGDGKPSLGLGAAKFAKAARALLPGTREVPVEDSAVGGGTVFVGLEATIDELEDALIKARDTARKSQKKVAELERVIQHQNMKIQGFTRQRNDRPMTPRPDFDPISKVLPEFNPSHDQSTAMIMADLCEVVQRTYNDDRKELEAKAMSNTIVEWLGDNQLCESDLVSRRPTFIGRGTGPNVPVYARFHGRIRNKKLHKGDVEGMLGKFWKARQLQRRSEGLDVNSVQEFLLDWLIKVTGSSNAAIELAYNIMDVCETYRADPDCKMFLRILEGEVSEERLFDEIGVVELLNRLFTHEDRSGTGFLPKDTVHSIMKQFFPAKSHDNMLKLKFTLLPYTLHDQPDSPVHYQALFIEDSNGNQTRFVETLRAQHDAEADEFLIDTEEAIRAEINTMTGMMPVRAIIDAVRQLDPKMPMEEIRKIVAAGLHITVSAAEKLSDDHIVVGEEFLAKMRRSIFTKRYSKPKRRMDDWSDSDGDAPLTAEDLTE